VKVTGDLSDLLVGHSTWDSYTAMTRIFKHYEWQIAHPAGERGRGVSRQVRPTAKLWRNAHRRTCVHPLLRRTLLSWRRPSCHTPN